MREHSKVRKVATVYMQAVRNYECFVQSLSFIGSLEHNILSIHGYDMGGPPKLAQKGDCKQKTSVRED